MGIGRMNITSQTIQELKQNISPVQAIEYYTGQRGSHGKYLCPFHNDTHPSITVKGDRWTCWVCGAKGDIIDFTQRYHDIGFRDAIARLSDDFGVPVDHGPVQVDPEVVTWNRIARETDQANRKQLREYLDGEINVYNTIYRALSSRGSASDTLMLCEEKLDWLIQERSRLGEIDHTAYLTPYEKQLISGRIR